VKPRKRKTRRGSRGRLVRKKRLDATLRKRQRKLQLGPSRRRSSRNNGENERSSERRRKPRRRHKKRNDYVKSPKSRSVCRRNANVKLRLSANNASRRSESERSEMRPERKSARNAKPRRVARKRSRTNKIAKFERNRPVVIRRFPRSWNRRLKSDHNRKPCHHLSQLLLESSEHQRRVLCQFLCPLACNIPRFRL
jgi:hypothetical protein